MPTICTIAERRTKRRPQSTLDRHKRFEQRTPRRRILRIIPATADPKFHIPPRGRAHFLGRQSALVPGKGPSHTTENLVLAGTPLLQHVEYVPGPTPAGTKPAVQTEAYGHGAPTRRPRPRVFPTTCSTVWLAAPPRWTRPQDDSTPFGVAPRSVEPCATLLTVVFSHSRVMYGVRESSAPSQVTQDPRQVTVVHIQHTRHELRYATDDQNQTTLAL